MRSMVVDLAYITIISSRSYLLFDILALTSHLSPKFKRNRNDGEYAGHVVKYEYGTRNGDAKLDSLDSLDSI
jgi:hypothetical protein